MKLFEKMLFGTTLALFVFMIALVSLQVLNRYIIQLSIPWTEELTRISYLLMIYVGSLLAVIQNNHIRITIIERRLPQWLRQIIWGLISVISSVFFVVVAFGNYTYTLINWDSKLPTMSGLTIGYVMTVVMICSGLMAVFFFMNAFKPVPEERDIEIRN